MPSMRKALMSSKGRFLEHQVITKYAQPIKWLQYRVPFAVKKEIDNKIHGLFKKGVIRESQSPLSAAVILLPKMRVDLKRNDLFVFFAF
jgi:hypothetical protein